jgi:hypothetical protein
MQQKILIHALIIADHNGRFLVDVVRNQKLKTDYLSGFIAALKMFGEETLGNIKDISINGLDIDMIIVTKYNLIMISVMDSDIPLLDFRDGCARALDVFYKIFGDKIEDWDGSLDTFRDFQDLLKEQIARYFEELREHEFKIRVKEMDVETKKIMNPEVEQSQNKIQPSASSTTLTLTPNIKDKDQLKVELHNILGKTPLKTTGPAQANKNKDETLEELIQRFELETSKKAFFAGRLTQEFMEWKNKYFR